MMALARALADGLLEGEVLLAALIVEGADGRVRIGAAEQDAVDNADAAVEGDGSAGCQPAVSMARMTSSFVPTSPTFMASPGMSWAVRVTIGFAARPGWCS
jgi:hypothetical protein